MAIMVVTIQSKIPVNQILKEFEEAVKAIEKWFAENPKRRSCITEGWYNERFTIRRWHVREDMEKARDAALKRSLCR